MRTRTRNGYLSARTGKSVRLKPDTTLKGYHRHGDRFCGGAPDDRLDCTAHRSARDARVGRRRGLRLRFVHLPSDSRAVVSSGRISVAGVRAMPGHLRRDVVRRGVRVDARQNARRRCLADRTADRAPARGSGSGSDAADGRARDGRNVVSLQPHARVRGSPARRPRRARGDECAGYATLRRMRAAAADRTQTTSSIYLICAVAWFVPGAGHLWLGRRQKGIVFLVDPHADVRVRALARGSPVSVRAHAATGGAGGDRGPRGRASVLRRPGCGARRRAR